MMTVTEKAAYLRGLFDGLKIDENTNEGKLFAAMIDLLDDLAVSVADLDEIAADMGEELDEISEDLTDLEDEVYGCDDEDCCCDDEVYEVKCPTCGEVLCIDEDILEDGEVKCPACGEELEFDFDEGCCCDCEND